MPPVPWDQRRNVKGNMDRIHTLTPIPSIFLNPSLRIIHASASYLAVSKFSLEECVGFNVYEFVQSKLQAPDVPSIRLAIQTALATRTVYVLEGIKSADSTYWSVRTIPIFDQGDLLYIILEAQDTTEQQLKRQIFQDQFYANETYRLLVDTVRDYAIFMLDTEGNITTWNTGAAVLKGYTPQEIVGRHFSVFYSEEDRIANKPGKELELCLRDGKVEDEGWRYRKDGTRFWANVIIAPLYRSNRLIGFSKVTRDLTERKAAESRLILAYEEAAKLKSDFLANMSHEIRTPMHGMLSALTLLTDTCLNDEQRELTSIIEESGSVLLRVINDILDYSKLASGQFSISLEAISIPDIIASVVRSIRAALESDVHVEISLDPQFPRSALGDALRYRQVLQNLVANATKFTETGYIRVHASFTLNQASYTVLTEVIDTGIGVPGSAADSLFTPFTQLNNATTKLYQGTGLGLSICKSLTKLMGGAIGFRPNPDQPGSIFWFTVTLGKTEDLEQLDRLECKLKSTTPSLPTDPFADIKLVASTRTLLVAEDNSINQKVILRLLKSLGFENVDIVSDGAQAARLTKKTPGAYSLILMDINMPVLDGIAATTEIRSAGIAIPIVAMTANAMKGDADTYIAKGLTDYIPKPVDRRLLAIVLLKWLG